MDLMFLQHLTHDIQNMLKLFDQAGAIVVFTNLEILVVLFFHVLLLYYVIPPQGVHKNM